MDKNKDNKNNILTFLIVVLIFGIIGIYLTFFYSNTSKYDSKIKAYQIDENEKWDSDGSMYYPIYYFKVKGKEYQCKSKSGSNRAPNKNKNIVYYDSKNPENCLTEFEKSSSKLIGIISLVISVLVVIFTLKKPSKHIQNSEINTDIVNSNPLINSEQQEKIENSIIKAEEIYDKMQLIIKRIILAFIIIVLFVFILFDFAIIKQTIKAKNYIETKATLVEKKEKSDSEITNEYIYTFKDKTGKEQEIIISFFESDIVKNEITIKYDENNPQEFYQEGQTYNQGGIMWFVIKIVIMILLIIAFFNKKFLNKISISTHIRKEY